MFKQNNLDKMGIALAPISSKLKVTMLVKLHGMTAAQAKEYISV